MPKYTCKCLGRRNEWQEQRNPATRATPTSTAATRPRRNSPCARPRPPPPVPSPPSPAPRPCATPKKATPSSSKSTRSLPRPSWRTSSQPTATSPNRSWARFGRKTGTISTNKPPERRQSCCCCRIKKRKECSMINNKTLLCTLNYISRLWISRRKWKTGLKPDKNQVKKTALSAPKSVPPLWTTQFRRRGGPTTTSTKNSSSSSRTKKTKSELWGSTKKSKLSTNYLKYWIRANGLFRRLLVK